MKTTKHASKTKFANWTFGIYRANNPSQALLGISFPSLIDGTTQWFVSDASIIHKVPLLIEKLIDTGANIDPEKDRKLLSGTLKKRLVDGLFIRKLGVNGGNYILLDKVYGPPMRPHLVEKNVATIAEKHLQSKGSHKVWFETVLKSAEKSSFLMFVTMQAHAAPLLESVMEGADEGFIINLAGDTSRGKTTTLMVGKSISGSPSSLITWLNSTRSLVENAAAMSDTLLAIDDLDKISSKPSFPNDFSALTHLLTSGQSAGYSLAVQKTLPNLTWSCCGLTCARATINDMVNSKGKIRDGHELVRCFDIDVPAPEEGGIWDRMEADDDPAVLTAQIQGYLTKAYGTALPEWLEHIYYEENTIRDAKALVEYFLDLLDLDPADNAGKRVAKKFGLIYAAGILAEEAGLLPWDRDDIEDIVIDFYRNAHQNMFSLSTSILAGFKNLKKMIMDEHVPSYPKNRRPCFRDIKASGIFLMPDGLRKDVFIQRKTFNHAFPDHKVAAAALGKLDDNNVVINTSCLKRIRIDDGGPKAGARKARYVNLDFNLLNGFFESQQL